MSRRALAVLALGAVAIAVTACRGGVASSPRGGPSAFTLAIEGSCAKLHVRDVGTRTAIVLGTYGLDEASAWSGEQTAHAAQALAFVAPNERTATIEPSLLVVLPRSPRGWIEGDVDIGGSGRGLWLERVVRTPEYRRSPSSSGGPDHVARRLGAWRRPRDPRRRKRGTQTPAVHERALVDSARV